QRDENQLHAAVVELIALDDAYIKYSTVQNWYPGDAQGVGGIYNFVTKRGECGGRNAHIAWTQVATGSAITCKYPSCALRGEGSSRGTHLPVCGGEEPFGHGRTRSQHLEDQRGPAVLLPGARHRPRGRGQHDRERLLQVGVQGAADGIRRRSAKPAGRQPGRRGRSEERRVGKECRERWVA